VEIIKVIILGLVQGLTEFLPISSSGHLVLVAEILNFEEQGVAFEVFVHVGTLFSILVAFRNELFKMIIAPFKIWIGKSDDTELKEFLNWDFYVIVGSIPAAVLGLLFKEQFEAAFSNIRLVLVFLFVTGTIMIISKFLKTQNKNFTYLKSFIIGIAQAFAIFPGISRSGSTIVTGMALGLNREKVAKFSFILSIPAIIGASILKINDILENPISNAEFLNLFIGALIAFISGYVAIIWLLDVVRKGKLEWFGYYCYFIVFCGVVWYIFN